MFIEIVVQKYFSFRYSDVLNCMKFFYFLNLRGFDFYLMSSSYFGIDFFAKLVSVEWNLALVFVNSFIFL